MLYTIGLSFSAEMIVKGFYENRIGRLFEWIGGHRQRRTTATTPPSGGPTARSCTRRPGTLPVRPGACRACGAPAARGAQLRHWERRFALSLEYGVKAGYAGADRLGLGRDPGPRRARPCASSPAPSPPRSPRSIRGCARSRGSAAASPPSRRRATPSSATSSNRLAATPIELSEIAGNDDIFVTLLLPANVRAPAGPGRLFEIPLEDRPGWRRLGLSVKVARLLPLLRATRAAGGEVEHVYDY